MCLCSKRIGRVGRRLIFTSTASERANRPLRPWLGHARRVSGCYTQFRRTSQKKYGRTTRVGVARLSLRGLANLLSSIRTLSMRNDSSHTLTFAATSTVCVVVLRVVPPGLQVTIIPCPSRQSDHWDQGATAHSTGARHENSRVHRSHNSLHTKALRSGRCSSTGARVICWEHVGHAHHFKICNVNPQWSISHK